MQKNTKRWLGTIVSFLGLTLLFIYQIDVNVRPFLLKIGNSNVAHGYADSANNLCSNMVGYWKFDTQTGSIVTDESGSGETLTFINHDNENWSSDVPEGIHFWNDYSYHLHASNYAIGSSGSITPLNIDGDITISVWIKYDSLTQVNTANSLVAFSGKNETKEENALYVLSINGKEKKLRLSWENGSDARDIITESAEPANIKYGEWHNIIVVRDSTEKQVRFIVDGVNLGSAVTYTLPPSGGTGSMLYVGTSPDNISGNGFAGYIDDLRIYNKAFSQDQINALAQGLDMLGGCSCGNGELEPPEECDDANSDNKDECTNICTVAKCGDGYVQPSNNEECDPPNTLTCTATCKLIDIAENSSSSGSEKSIPANCGNRIIDDGEECDNGNLNGKGQCSEYCTILYCGDGILTAVIGEECEPTPFQMVNGKPVFKEPICGEVCSIPEINEKTKEVTGGCQRLFLQPCEVENPPSTDEEDDESTHDAADEEQIGVYCGNTIVDEGEECDNGGKCNGGDLDGEDVFDEDDVRTCTKGGGTVIALADDGCSELCNFEICGDGIIQTKGLDGIAQTDDDEMCDNGSICSNNPDVSCSKGDDCVFETLCKDVGDGTKSCGGGMGSSLCRTDADCELIGYCIYNDKKDINCNAQCKIPSVCGNGIIEYEEQCDDGNIINNDGCDSECKLEMEILAQSSSIFSQDAICGNGILEYGEECDEGSLNSLTSGTCKTDCTLHVCGDGIINEDEQCDNGMQNSDYFPDSCRTNCLLPYCGDNVRDSGEDCDGSPGCQSDCVFPSISTCGDGIVQITEECDDGNLQDGDGCSSKCKLEPKLIDNISISSSPAKSSVSSVLSFYNLNANDNESSLSSLEISSSELSKIQVYGNIDLPIVTLLPPAQTFSDSSAVSHPIGSVLPIYIAHAPLGATGPSAAVLVVFGTASGYVFKKWQSKKPKK